MSLIRGRVAKLVEQIVNRKEVQRLKTYNEILYSEYSKDFDEIRKKMMVVGYYKYGSIEDNIENAEYDILASLKKRLEYFEKTGNTEYLADVSNFCMMLYMYREKLGYTYIPTDSDKSCGIVGRSVKYYERGLQ